MSVPLAQLRGGPHLLGPLVEVGVGLLDATRPEPIDQDPLAVLFLHRVVCPADAYVPGTLRHDFTDPRVHGSANARRVQTSIAYVQDSSGPATIARGANEGRLRAKRLAQKR